MPSIKELYEKLQDVKIDADSINVNTDGLESLLATTQADIALIKADLADGVSANIQNAQVALGENAPNEAVQIGGYNLADNKLYPIAVDSNGVQSISGTVTANTGLDQPLTNTQLRDDPVVIEGSITALQSTPANLKGQAQLIDSSGTVHDYAQVGVAGTPSSDVISVQGVEDGLPVAIWDNNGVITVDGSVNIGEGSISIYGGYVQAQSDKGYVNQSEENQTTQDSGMSQVVFNANTARKFIFIQNLSDTDMYVGLGFTPSSSTPFGILLKSGGGELRFDSGFIPSSQVNIVCSSDSKQFIALEG